MDLDYKKLHKMIPKELGSAIVMLINIYLDAREKEFIYNPIAFALYQTWKEFDKR